MSGFRFSSSMLFVLTALAACGGDPVSQQRPDAAALAQSDASRGVLNANDQHGSRQIAILDDCDADDLAWAATGGCVLRGGAVPEAEFGAFLVSPLAAAVVGHPGWRNEPSYLRVTAGRSVQVRNQGGRAHTFTPVAAFGGGFVPPLNFGLTAAPECVPPTGTPQIVPPGGRLELENLAPGNHRFQCCLHPWMRALVKVE
ncbi:MAG TPA: hypothetical protein VLE53_15105 [Gemmatimonadaceae bacterium]|nr:hypothetical protein [Gemmatimonadaceae bacterium]